MVWLLELVDRRMVFKIIRQAGVLFFIGRILLNLVFGLFVNCNGIRGMINLYWHKSINFGDMLSPYLLAKFKGVSIEDINYVEANDERDKYVLTGSILSTPGLINATVFGAGFINHDDTFTGNNVDFKGVRGSLTFEKLKPFTGDIIIGDPSYSLPFFYDPKPAKKYKLGIIPHISDFEECYISKTLERSISVIDLRMKDWETITDTVERVIYQICQCDRIISESLHGLIVAGAYDIPATRLFINSGKIVGDGFKYNDYFPVSTKEEIFEAGKLI